MTPDAANHPVLSDPGAVAVLRALVDCGREVATDAVAGRLPPPSDGLPPGAVPALLRRLAEAGLATYRTAPADGWLPRTLHVATPRGRAAAAASR